MHPLQVTFCLFLLVLLVSVDLILLLNHLGSQDNLDSVIIVERISSIHHFHFVLPTNLTIFLIFL